MLLTVCALLMVYCSNDDRLVASLLVSSQISDYKVNLPMNSSVELKFGNVSVLYVSVYSCVKCCEYQSADNLLWM